MRPIPLLLVLLVSAVATAQTFPTAPATPIPETTPEEAPNPVRKATDKTGVVVLAPVEDGQAVVEEDGSLYRARGYKGVVPGIRDQAEVPAKRPENEAFAATRAILEWVGFQPFPAFSRVFIQMSGRFTFSVTRPQAQRIEVRLPNTDLSTPNDGRHLITRDFPTAVDRIDIGADPDGTLVVGITLKKPVGYLYRQEGRYIFVDTEL